MPHTLLSTVFKSVEFEGHNKGLIFLVAKTAFFQRRHNYIIITYCRASIYGTFYNFSVTRNVRMIHDKNYEK